MERVLDGSKPYFRFFEELSAIPRDSGNEAAVGDYLIAFARARGLRHRRDGIGNVVIEKDGSPGFEAAPPVVLQAHTDMVCVKRDGVDHDFTKDPLKLYVEEGWLRAEGTSLGADDGCGVAAMLYILDDHSAEHPSLECVFTVQEETGMGGAAVFDYSSLRGRHVVGLDSLNENLFLISTAGGQGYTLRTVPHGEEHDGVTMTIRVSGLVGGHPGVEIHKGAANAIDVVARILDHLRASGITYRIVELHGGDKGKAIPAQCHATITVEGLAADELGNLVDAAAESQLQQRRATDPEMRIDRETVTERRPVLSEALSSALCDALLLLPSGVVQMSPVFEGAVQTSSLLAASHIDASNATITVSTRSSHAAQLKDLGRTIARVASVCGLELELGAGYPGMPYREHSPFRDLYARVMKEVWDKDLLPIAAHGGVELGYFALNIPDAEIVALGPKITGAHTYDEAMEIESFERVCLFLAVFLSSLREEPHPAAGDSVPSTESER